MKQTESGEISFLYTQLSPLKNEGNTDTPRLNFQKVRMISYQKNLKRTFTMFHATGDFNIAAAGEGVKR
jgi:hypothetical protein